MGIRWAKQMAWASTWATLSEGEEVWPPVGPAEGLAEGDVMRLGYISLGDSKGEALTWTGRRSCRRRSTILVMLDGDDPLGLSEGEVEDVLWCLG